MKIKLGLIVGLFVFGTSAAPAFATPPTFQATALATKYCDDTWKALNTIAVPVSDPSGMRVKGIVDRLADTLGAGPWRVVVFSYADVGWPAIALLGNRIVVQKAFADEHTDAELAFIMAHEMGHVELGHIPERFQALLEASGNTATTWQQASKFTHTQMPLYREEEFEADKFGLKLATSAHFDAQHGAASALSHLREDAEHPAPHDRISALSLDAVEK